MEKIILIGAGGYAKSVLDSLDDRRYIVEGFIDEFSGEDEHLGYPVLARTLSDIPAFMQYKYFIAIGDNQNRKRWYDILTQRELSIISVIDKTAIVSDYAKLGRGCFVGKQAIINSRAIIGDDCIINTRALVEHGCRVGNHVNLSTNSVINGDVCVGDGSFIGSCSVTIGQRRIGKRSVVGAGAVVINSFGDDVTVVGAPARMVKKRESLTWEESRW